MMKDMPELLERYVAWVRDNTALREINGGWAEITTPHLDRHNDCLQIYVKQQGDKLLLTDDGYIISDLIQSGCTLDGDRRRALLKMTLAGFGVEEREGRLESHATPQSFPIRKHNLLQAMLAVNDLFCLAGPTVAQIFEEDVTNWLDEAGIRYIPKVKFTGRTGYDHLFPFVIPKSASQPERILQTINRPGKDAAETAVLKWIDTKDTRPSDARAFAILNDQDRRTPAGVAEALESYDIRPVFWSKRDEVLEELAA